MQNSFFIMYCKPILYNYSLKCIETKIAIIQSKVSVFLLFVHLGRTGTFAQKTLFQEVLCLFHIFYPSHVSSLYNQNLLSYSLAFFS